MHPTLIEFGPVAIHTYGAMIALGFFLALTLIERLSQRKDVSNLVLILLAVGLCGSRFAYVWEHWEREFAHNLAEIIRIDHGGLMFYGGFISALAAFLVWCRVKRERILPLADLFAVALPLAHAFGRVGCFFYGCCYGRRSDSIFAVRFPVHSPAWFDQLHAGVIEATAPAALGVLPTQLFEAVALSVIFVVTFVLYRRIKKPDFALRASDSGLVAGVYLILYAFVRFGIEFLRGDERFSISVLSISQAISLGVFVAGVVFIGAFCYNKRS